MTTSGISGNEHPDRSLSTVHKPVDHHLQNSFSEGISGSGVYVDSRFSPARGRRTPRRSVEEAGRLVSLAKDELENTFEQVMDE